MSDKTVVGSGSAEPKGKTQGVGVGGVDNVEPTVFEEKTGNQGQKEADASGDSSKNPNEPQTTYEDTEVDRVAKEKEARNKTK